MAATALDALMRLADFAEGVRGQVYLGADSPGGPAEFATLVADWNAAAAGDSAERELPESAYAAAAASLASVLHALVHSAYDAGRGESVPGAELGAAERALDDQLALLRHAALTGSLASCSRTLEALSGAHLEAVLHLADRAGRAGPDFASGRQAIRIAGLGRRLASLGAAGVMLQRRLANPRLRTTTAGIAERRTSLTVEHVALPRRPVALAGQPPLSRIAVLLRIAEVGWEDRGDTPLSRLVVDEESELRVHFKNVRLNGVGGAQWAWARCKVEPPAADGTTYGVVEFEGPTTTQSTCWESWLQVESRTAYDVAPRSIDLVAEFPPLGTPYAALDLYSRIAGEDA